MAAARADICEEVVEGEEAGGEVSELEAGRELDALIVQRIIGAKVVWQDGEPCWAHIHRDPRIYPPSSRVPVPPFSTEMAAAWSIIEHLTGKGWWVRIEHVEPVHRLADERWTVNLGEYEGDGPTAPLAICRAALRAMDANQPQ